MEFTALMQSGKDSAERETKNLLVWAILALNLFDESLSSPDQQLCTGHLSRSAGLNRRLAAAEKEEWSKMQ